MTLRVLDPAGTPVPSATVTVRDRVREIVATPGRGGELRMNELAPGPVRVRASAPGFLAAERSFIVGRGAVAGATVRLPRRTRVTVTVKGRPGAEPLRLRVKPADGRTRYLDGDVPVVPREVRSLGSGERFPTALPADAGLVVDAKPAACAPVRIETTLRAGDVHLTVPCHRGGVSGTVFLPRNVKSTAAVPLEVCARALDPEVRQLTKWSGGTCVKVEPGRRFELAPLPPGRWVLEVAGASPAHLAEPVETRVPDVGIVDVGDIRLETGLLLAGRVIGEEGPVEGAVVRCALEGRGRRWNRPARTDGKGRFSLAVDEAGPWLLRVEAPGYAPLLAEHVRAPAEDLELRPGRGASLEFSLVDPDGLPLPTARLLLRSPGGGRLLEARRIEADEGGSYRVEGMVTGEASLDVLSPGFAPVRVPRVRLEEGQTTDLGELVAGRGRVLAGTVLDPEGNPVEGAVVRPWVRRREEAAFEAVTGPDGRFVVEGAPGRALDLVVVARGWAPLIVPIPATSPGRDDGTADLVLRLHRGGTVTCRVESRDGAPLEDALVVVRGLESFCRGSTGSDGTAVLEHVPPGEIRIQALVNPLRPTEGILEKMVTVPEGGEIQVAFRPGILLEGKILRRGAPCPGARIVAVGLGTGVPRETAIGRADENGHYRLALSGEGTWSLEVLAGTCRFHRPVSVSREGGQIDIVLPPVDLQGRVIDAASGDPVGGAEVSWSAPGARNRGAWNVELPDGGWATTSWDTVPGATAVADAEGSWVLCVPEGGGWHLRLDGGTRYETFERDVGDVLENPLIVSLRRRDELLRVRVRLADGGLAGSPVGLIVERRSGLESVNYLPPSGEREFEVPPEPFRLWAIARGYGMARTRWLDPGGDVPDQRVLEILVERGGWLRLALSPELAREVDEATFRLHVYDNEGNDLFQRVEQVGAIEYRATDVPGEVFLGVFPKGTWTLAWETGKGGGSRTVVVDEDPALVVLDRR